MVTQIYQGQQKIGSNLATPPVYESIRKNFVIMAKTLRHKGRSGQ